MNAAGGTVVVLGATGFLGTWLSKRFAAAGRQVLCVSTSAGGDGAARLDLCADDDRLAAVLAAAAPDVVVNASGRVWQVTEEQMAEANGAVLTRIVAAMRDKCPGARLIQLGTVHEYGPGTPGTATTEDQPAAPVTPYGRAKLVGSRTVLEAAGDGLDGVVLRLANVCGPGTRPGSLLGAVGERLARVAHTGEAEPLTVPPLRAHRDFVDVRDAVDAVLATAGADPALVAGQVINIGSGRALPVRAAVDRMVALSGLGTEVVEQAPPGAPGGGRRDVEWQLLDITRAARVLGWRPRREWDDTLRDQLAAAQTAVARAATEGD